MTLCRGADPGDQIGLFFTTGHWTGQPTNREPHKCRAVRWFLLNNLPERIIDYPAPGIDAYHHRTHFSIRGWNTTTTAAASPN